MPGKQNKGIQDRKAVIPVKSVTADAGSTRILVSFRPTLDAKSLELLKKIGEKWRLRGSPTASRIATSFVGKDIQEGPLAKFMRDTWPNIEPRSIRSAGVLYRWPPEIPEELRRLAWDAHLEGNMSKILRILIHYTAIKEGFTVELT